MKGIEKITERILSEAREEAGQQVAGAKAQAEEILAGYNDQAKKLYENRLAAGRVEAAAAADRKNRSALLESKKDILGTKQKMIEQAYAEAKENIINMPEADYVEFLANKAADASSTGEEMIVLNAADKERVGAKVAEAANAKLAAAGKKADIKLSDETMKISGGLFLKQGDVSINCSVDSLMDLVREELDVKVARVLFG